MYFVFVVIKSLITCILQQLTGIVKGLLEMKKAEGPRVEMKWGKTLVILNRLFTFLIVL